MADLLTQGQDSGGGSVGLSEGSGDGRCTWPACSARSVRLKLDGRFNYMITSCITSVSNFFICLLCPHTDPMGEEHHARGTSRISPFMVVVGIHSCFPSLALSNTHSLHAYAAATLDALIECAEEERDSNCGEPSGSLRVLQAESDGRVIQLTL